MAEVSKVTTDWMAEKYAEFNQKYFGGRLPSNCAFKTDMSTKHFGNARATFTCGSDRSIVTYGYEIRITRAYAMTEETKINTLVHEMIHILDYQDHPEHYGYYDWRRVFCRHRYDAHGDTFFIPEAKRLSQYGFNITRLVTAEEMDSSKLDGSIEKRIQNKKERGYILGYVCYTKQERKKAKDDGMMFKTTAGQIDAIKRSCKIINMRWHKYAYIEFYRTNTPVFERWSGCREYIKGWYRSKYQWENTIESIKSEYGTKLELVDREVFFTEYEPEELKDEPKSETVPLFRMRLTNGKTIELKDKTKKEIEQVLREQFPNASDETIQKIMNNKSFFPMSEQRVTITESDIKDMVNEVIANIGMDQFDDIDNEKSYVRNKDGSVTISMA